MEQNIPSSWQNILSTETSKTYFRDLGMYLRKEYNNYSCYPPQNEIYTAFKLCSFEKIKVVIIGQDPYHGPNQANGLCFSVNRGLNHPPSLRNVFKELQSDLGISYPESGDLSSWASQGVLMLNATLTVRKSEPGSHQKQGWEQFTDAVIECVSKQKEHIVFLLWGGFAIKKGSKIDKKKHLVLESGHPSPMSANRGYWFGNKHFSQCNEYLKLKKKSGIDWSLKQSQGLLFT